MDTNITIVESKYSDYTVQILEEDVERLTRLNESLESEVKRLRVDKAHLMEQLTLIKEFSDSLWNKLKANHYL